MWCCDYMLCSVVNSPAYYTLVVSISFKWSLLVQYKILYLCFCHPICLSPVTEGAIVTNLSVTTTPLPIIYPVHSLCVGSVGRYSGLNTSSQVSDVMFVSGIFNYFILFDSDKYGNGFVTSYASHLITSLTNVPRLLFIRVKTCL